MSCLFQYGDDIDFGAPPTNVKKSTAYTAPLNILNSLSRDEKV